MPILLTRTSYDMNLELSLSIQMSRKDTHVATALNVSPASPGNLFYSQTAGYVNQYQLLECKLTGTPALLLPAVTFTSNRYALDLGPQVPGMYTMHQAKRMPDMP